MDRLRNGVVIRTAILVLLIGIVWYDHTMGQKADNDKIRETALTACVKLNESNATLKDYILDQIARSEKTIPTLDYYMQHPDEARNALNNLRKQRERTIKAFAPVKC